MQNKLSERIRENRYLRFSDASIGDPKIWMITDNGDYLKAIEALERKAELFDKLKTLPGCRITYLDSGVYKIQHTPESFERQYAE